MATNTSNCDLPDLEVSQATSSSTSSGRQSPEAVDQTAPESDNMPSSGSHPATPEKQSEAPQSSIKDSEASLSLADSVPLTGVRPFAHPPPSVQSIPDVDSDTNKALTPSAPAPFHNTIDWIFEPPEPLTRGDEAVLEDMQDAESESAESVHQTDAVNSAAGPANWDGALDLSNSSILQRTEQPTDPLDDEVEKDASSYLALPGYVSESLGNPAAASVVSQC